MSNADQLRYLRMQETLDKKVTSIRRKSPEPLILHKQPKQPVTQEVTQEVTQDIPRPDPATQPLIPIRTPISVELRNFIEGLLEESLKEERHKTRIEICKAFDEYSHNLYHTLDTPEAEILVMGEAQFQAFMRVVLEDEA